ncbi:4F2 cell-surface antigen heavy chain [Orchesella cincta]|uniref:4F2 cell-surface antigen heavy chain n=1 Tax=Orchesella cincta TaxID=48709 RepID=A0A1D2M7X8_ORCCI|nr:4F2 cell-surface antigen heavy chain [Orchesella cincta]
MSSEKREASPEASPLKGPAPKAEPEDTSDVAFEDGIPLSPMADPAVQFTSGTPANGDAKVEIGDSGVAPTFVGLGKEELMKYANDPFWVRLRWFLFILFWILWLAMLVGAIVIIILAPRCAEKKTVTDTFYQIKASDLIKDSSQLDAQTQYLKDLGMEIVIISDVLQHDPNEPEAVTNIKALDKSIDEGVFADTVKKLRSEGMRVLLQLVPNHVGTSHEWFNSTAFPDYFVRKPYDEVKQSPWVMQDRSGSAWSADPGNNSIGYLHQFSGNVADLNFDNDEVVSAFKDALSDWRLKKIDGFVISKASYLVEDLNNLMSSQALRNNLKNVEVIKRMVGISSSGPILVELDDASEETLKQYKEKGFTPIVKSIDASNTNRILETLVELNTMPDAVINLHKTSTSPDKARLINLVAIAGGSHALINHDTAKGEKDFLTKLIQFQRDNPRGKGVTVEHASTNDIITALRSDGDDRLLILANFGNAPATFDAQASNVTESAAGKIVLATPNAEIPTGNTTQDTISLNPLSGVVIKLADNAKSE